MQLAAQSLRLAALVASVTIAFPQKPASPAPKAAPKSVQRTSAYPPIYETLAAELDRNLKILKEKADPPPYFISYEVTEEESDGLSATRGSVQARSRAHRRVLDCSVRVGSRQLDNYHVLEGDRPRASASTSIPVEDVPAAISRAAWLQTDRAWRAASQRYLKVRSTLEVKSKDPTPIGDFTEEFPVVSLDPVPLTRFSAEDWAPRLRKLSAEFNQFSGILTSEVSLSWRREVRTFVSSEGARVQHGRTFARLMVVARGRTYDGHDLSTMESVESEDPARFPKDDALLELTRKVGNDLVRLLKAAPADPYVGPAILSGHAAGVFFHEIFGHRIEGHRQTDETEGQTFSNSVGKPVLPEFLSVTADPTRASSGSTDLNGWYRFDDEGTPARPVPIVEKGILKNFLMSRAPVQGFDKSNGHGRRQPGYEPFARQSNLIVEAGVKVPFDQLRKMLIEEIVRQRKPYGLFFQRVTGGFTTTRRAGLQAFTVVPLVVYRIYPDGRPDELIRGVDIVGTPLASFAKILAASDTPEVFNGYCGAESGQVPVSAVSPALLVGEIEIQRKPQTKDLPPLLPRPMVEVLP